MTPSVVLVVLQPARAHPRLPREPAAPPRGPFELCVVDNASNDGTEDVSPTASPAVLPAALPAERRERRAHPRAQPGRAARRRASSSASCTTTPSCASPRWLARLRGALAAGDAHRPGRPLRRAAAPRATDATWGGPSCTASRRRRPLPRARRRRWRWWTACASSSRATSWSAVGGFDEGYGFFHGYDRDLSFAVREAGPRAAWW